MKSLAFTERVLKKLEWDKVIQQVMPYAACSLGKEALIQLRPYETRAEAQEVLDTVAEALEEILRMGPLPYGGITDIRAHLQKATIGGVLSAEALLAIAECIRGGRNVRQQIERLDESILVPRLRSLAETLFDARQTEQEIRTAVTDEATIHDGASPELRRLRLARRGAEQKVRQVLDNMLRSHQKYLQDPVIAMRGSRFCLPVRVEFKNQIAGVVHDTSASGATVFIEPMAVIEQNRKVQELLMDEDREIERILQRLSGIVAEVADELLANVQLLAYLDSVFARAAYARAGACTQPELTTDRRWSMVHARHPLIDKATAVPLTVTLGEDFDTVVITGPNTGGKTVSLKTVGLLTIMAMSGCFIPSAEGSRIGWCDGVFADIGDEQSIEQSLSTFSSHLRNIVQMLGDVTEHSLVLLDELGAGTDPAEGAALAVAILQELHRRDCRVIATTHYAQLKAYAFHQPRVTNASVEFDIETLRPTYRLLIGVPGRSNALAIAARLGLPNDVIETARSSLASEDVAVEELIAKIEVAHAAADRARQEAESMRTEARALEAEWSRKLAQLAEEEQEWKQKAKVEAERVLAHAREEAEAVIKELRSRKQAGYKDHELVNLRKRLEQAEPNHGDRRFTKSQSQAGEIMVGSTVRLLSLGQEGEVVEMSADGKDMVVQLGQLRSKVKRSQVEWVKSPAKAENQTSGGGQTSFRRASRQVPLQLDVRGETVDEAMFRVERYLDDAVLAGLQKVTIIHGKGTGALRDGIRRRLGGHRLVLSWVPGGHYEGGDGATIVELAK